MKLKPWIVGEANPYGADPGFAMYPLPERSAGGRLCSLILGMKRHDYLEAFERRNLCPSKWSVPVARATAREIVISTLSSIPSDRAAPLILLGSKVSQQFGFEFKPWTTTGHRFAILPHPSGLCRLWNEPRAYERARETILAVAPHLAPLLGVSRRGEDAA